MPFKAGDKLRVKQDITRAMCKNSCIPSSLAGVECVYERGPDAFEDREAVTINGSPWYMLKECLEYVVVPCMFAEGVI